MGNQPVIPDFDPAQVSQDLIPGFTPDNALDPNRNVPKGIVGEVSVVDSSGRRCKAFVRDMFSDHQIEAEKDEGKCRHLFAADIDMGLPRIAAVPWDGHSQQDAAQLRSWWNSMSRIRRYDLLLDLRNGPILGKVHIEAFCFDGQDRSTYDPWFKDRDKHDDTAQQAYYGDVAKQLSPKGPRTIAHVSPSKFDHTTVTSLRNWDQASITAALLKIAVEDSIRRGFQGRVELTHISCCSPYEGEWNSLGILDAKKVSGGFEHLYIDPNRIAEWQAKVDQEPVFFIAGASST